MLENLWVALLMTGAITITMERLLTRLFTKGKGTVDPFW